MQGPHFLPQQQVACGRQKILRDMNVARRLPSVFCLLLVIFAQFSLEIPHPGENITEATSSLADQARPTDNNLRSLHKANIKFGFFRTYFCLFFLTGSAYNVYFLYKKQETLRMFNMTYYYNWSRLSLACLAVVCAWMFFEGIKSKSTFAVYYIFVNFYFPIVASTCLFTLLFECNYLPSAEPLCAPISSLGDGDVFTEKLKKLVAEHGSLLDFFTALERFLKKRISKARPLTEAQKAQAAAVFLASKPAFEVEIDAMNFDNIRKLNEIYTSLIKMLDVKEEDSEPFLTCLRRREAVVASDHTLPENIKAFKFRSNEDFDKECVNLLALVPEDYDWMSTEGRDLISELESMIEKEIKVLRVNADMDVTALKALAATLSKVGIIFGHISSIKEKIDVTLGLIKDQIDVAEFVDFSEDSSPEFHVKAIRTYLNLKSLIPDRQTQLSQCLQMFLKKINKLLEIKTPSLDPAENQENFNLVDATLKGIDKLADVKWSDVGDPSKGGHSPF